MSDLNNEYGIWYLALPYISEDTHLFSGQVQLGKLCTVCHIFNKIISTNSTFNRKNWITYIEKFDEYRKINQKNHSLFGTYINFGKKLYKMIMYGQTGINNHELLPHNMERELNDIKYTIEREALSKITYDKILNLFGGKKRCETLPILDISHIEMRGDYIDMIRPDDMSCPIMRGVDKYNRIFFTIRFRDVSNNKYHCQTLFQHFRYSTNCCNWITGTSSLDLISFSGYLIDNCVVNKYIYDTFLLAIKNNYIKDDNGLIIKVIE